MSLLKFTITIAYLYSYFTVEATTSSSVVVHSADKSRKRKSVGSKRKFKPKLLRKLKKGKKETDKQETDKQETDKQETDKKEKKDTDGGGKAPKKNGGKNSPSGEDNKKKDSPSPQPSQSNEPIASSSRMTHSPTNEPSKTFTSSPSLSSTNRPSIYRSNDPSPSPSVHTSESPTEYPSHYPSLSPTPDPSDMPSKYPSIGQSLFTSNPSPSATNRPSIHRSHGPSSSPSVHPSERPSKYPSHVPSLPPTLNPSDRPSKYPSYVPSLPPTLNPSDRPSIYPSYVQSNFPSVQSGTSDGLAIHQPSKVALGHYQSAVIIESELKSWGENSHGQLGNGLLSNLLTPTTIYSNIKQIAFGNVHACAIFSDTIEPHLQCWGDNRYGQLGNNSIENSLEPLLISIGESVWIEQIDLGSFHSCAIDNLGKLWCWGYNRHGQLGDGGGLNVLAPRKIVVHENLGVKQVALGDMHTCAILQNHDLKCWGSNLGGQLGDGSKVASSTPRTVYLNEDIGVKQIALGGYHTCAVLMNDELYCWGFNQYGQLGDNSNVNSVTPKKIFMSGGVGVKALSAGGFHTCAILMNEELKCFGGNHEGQLGDGSRVNSTTPRRIIVDERSNIEHISLGAFHSCATLESNALKCWGKNTSGQLGDGSLSNSLTPKLISLKERTPPIISSITSGGNMIQFGLGQFSVAAILILPYLYVM